MRAVLRLASSAITFVFLALMVLTTETVATELGFVSEIQSLVRGSWRTVSSSGYVITLYAGFWLSLGVAATLWTDYFVRKARAATGGRSMAIFDLCNDPDRLLIDDLRVDFATITKTAAGSYIADLQFTEPKVRYVVSALCDAPAEWAELIKTERFLRVEIAFRQGTRTVRCQHHRAVLPTGLRHESPFAGSRAAIGLLERTLSRSPV